MLHKNAAPDDVAAAVASLGFAPELVQVVPEPVAWHRWLALACVGIAGTFPSPIAGERKGECVTSGAQR